jgi:single-stranded-DNA-specific exonuclease
MLQLLYNRGLTDEAKIQAFLEGRYLQADDPFLLPDMEQAVLRIEEAIARDERIFVYGDFDADGVTATVLLVQALRGLGLSRNQVQPYIPDRVDEGYGLNKEALTSLKEEKGADLVITVDCGIRSVGEVTHARSIGLDMIVTDHHSIGPKLPPAVALINPKRKESAYPERMLAGVGIAYKLAQALRGTMSGRAQFDETRLLDLVALGTVADLAPLQGENRVLVKSGLEVLNRGERPGVFALTRISGLTPGQITAENIGFGLGPRINAAGRLSHAYDAARLLATNNMLMAERYAQALNELNQERRSLTRRLSKQAEEMVTEGDPILIAGDPEFASGVVGLVASRLAEKHYRPAIVMEQGAVESRASCRSIPGFHITEALDEVGYLLERHGGHAQAAGFTIRNENLEQFKTELSEIAARRLADVELTPTLEVDAELCLHQIDWALQEQLAQLEPTGQANSSPVFVSRNVNVIRHRAVGQDGAHLQLEVNDGPHGFSCIAFRQGAWAASLPRRVDIVYTIGVNEWNGRRKLQLVVQDIQPAADSN